MLLIYLLLSFLFTLVFLKLFIDRICKTKLFRKEENIESNKKSCIQVLHSHKKSTPSMGGLGLNLSLVLFTFIYFVVNKTMLWTNLLLCLFGIMGFVDDYIKIKKPRDGVSPGEKLTGLTLISIAIVTYLLISKQITPSIMIPFTNIIVPLNTYIFAAIIILILVASSNSVNITDGLDGLAVGISAIAFAFIGVVAFRLKAEDVLFTSVVFEGGCLATLFFNKHPAKIFMGDTGSLLLGGAIAVLLIKLNISLLVIIVLIVCFAEMLSVVIQLFSLKFFNKRVFKIAPFHHHLEKSGWPETKITYIFWAVTLIACIVAYLSLAAGGVI